jgi:hypothetical protein
MLDVLDGILSLFDVFRGQSWFCVYYFLQLANHVVLEIWMRVSYITVRAVGKIQCLQAQTTNPHVGLIQLLAAMEVLEKICHSSGRRQHHSVHTLQEVRHIFGIVQPVPILIA